MFEHLVEIIAVATVYFLLAVLIVLVIAIVIDSKRKD